MADVNANINIDINSSDALAGLKRLENQINSFQRSIAASNAAASAQQASINRALLDGINATGLFSAKQVSAIDSATRFTNALEKNKLSLGEYTKYASSQLPGLSRVFRREFETMERVATDRVKAINTQYLAMGKTVDGVTKAIKSTPSGLAKGYSTEVAMAAQRQQLFNKLIDDGSTKLLNWGKNTQWAGRQLMVGLSLPMAAFGTAAAAAFMELDKATVQLKRVYGDLSTTTAEVDANAEAIKNLGAEYTKYGIAVSDTISLGARAAATGATNESLMAATEQTLRFATLGQIDYNQALDTTISLQTAFGVSNEDLASKIDFLNAVENQTILTIEDMSLAIPRVATVVKGLGGDVEDLAVMMTAMREGGVSAENAANGLKSGLASMINPTNKAKEMLKGFGINLEGIVNQYQGDLLGTIRAFGMELDKLSDMDRQRALEKTFGKYQYARMSALFDNMISKSGQAARAMDLAGYSMEQLADIADKELGTISESTTVKFQASLEQLKLAIAPIGEAFLKVATPAIEVVTKIADAFNSLPDSIKNAIGVATIAIAGIGPVLLMGVGLMGNLIANIIKGIQWWRKLGARVKGDASAFDYMAKAELDALTATEALEGSATGLTTALGLQAGAVRALTKEYGRFTAVAGGAAGAMGAMPTRGRAAGPRLKMAKGGVVPGSGSGDKIPAMLEPGETVVTKSASKQYAPIIAAMNAGTLQGFQQGLDPQSARESLVFAHAQAPSDLADDIVAKIKKEAPGSKYLQQATRMQGLSNFGVIAPERFNRGQMSGTQAAKLFQDPSIVDRTMYPMYEAIARSMGARTPAQVKQIMSDPAIQKDVRSFADNIGRGLARAGAKNIGDAQFYSVVEDSLAKADMSAASREAIQKSRNVTTVAAYGGGIREKGERVALGTARQEKVFGTSGGVSYKSTSMIKKAQQVLGQSGMLLAGSFSGAVRSVLKIKSPSEDAKQVVEEYVDGMEVGAKQNVKDAAKAGKQTGQAYSGAVKQSVNATTGQQMTRQQYVAQQSAARRNAYNASRMQQAGMSDIQISRTQRRLEESKRRQESAAIAAERKAQSAKLREEGLRRRQQEEADAARRARDERRAARRGKISRGIGRAGGAIGALSLIPFMAQDAEGKFMGMDANMLGMGMMAAPMIGPAMKGIGAGAAGLAGAMGVSTAAVAGIAAPVAAIGVAAILLKRGFDSNVAAGRALADSMTTNAQEQKAMADVFGTTTYAERRRQREVKKLTGLTTEQQKQGREFVATDQGKAMVDEAMVGFEKRGRMFANTLGIQLSQMVVSGAISPANAKSIAAGITEAVGKEDMTASVVAQINKILGPGGEDITNSPLKVMAQIEASIVGDEKSLAASVGAKGPEGFNVFERMFSGDYDAAVERSIAYAESVTQNTAAIVSSYEDQIMAQKDLAKSLNDQMKTEEDLTKKKELERKRNIANQTAARLQEQRDRAISQRREMEMGAYRGRAESINAARQALEEQVPGMNAGALLRQTDREGMGGILGSIREAQLGKQFNEQQANEFELSWIVDLRAGRIDPQALQTLQWAEEEKAGTANNVLSRVVELQATGNWKQANEILQATAGMDKEVLTIFNSEIKGKTPEEIVAYANVLNAFPTDIAVKIAAEVGDMKLPDLQNLVGAIESLQNMGIDVASLISANGVKGLLETNDALVGVEKSMKDFKKELGAISKIKTVPDKIEKTVEVVTKIADANGMEVSKEQIKENLKQLADDTDLTKQQIMNLSPDIFTKSLIFKIKADQLRSQGQGLINGARYAAMGDPEAGKAMAAEGQALIDAANAIDAAAATDVNVAADAESDTPGPRTTDTPGGDGGKKSNPFKDFKAGIVEQIKRYADAEASLKNLMNAKYSFFNILKMSSGIDDKIRKAGLSPLIAEQLMGMAPAEANKILGKLTGKGGKLTAEGRGLQDRMIAASISGTMSDAQTRAATAGQQQRVTASLVARGASSQAISAIAGDPKRAAEYATLLDKVAKGGAKAEKAIKQYIAQLEKASIAEEAAASATQRAVEAAERRRRISFINTARAGGQDQALIEYVSGDAGLMAEYASIDKNDEKAVQAFFDGIKQQMKDIQLEAYKMNPFDYIAEQANEAMDAIRAQFAPDQLRLEDESAAAFESSYGMSKDAAQDLIEKNNITISQYEQQVNSYERMNAQEQRLIQAHEREKKQWQDKIDDAQNYINGWQRSIDLLNKQVAERNHQADLLNHELDLMSRAEEQINETYNKRAEALDEVEAINNRILESQRSQLDISRSLSSGDVYAAAEAAQQMREQQAQQAATDARDALTAARDAQIQGLRSSGGMSRGQIEDQLWQINQQNYQTSLEVYALEDKIYQKNQEIYGYKAEIDKIDQSIKEHTDKIWQNSGEILRIENELIAPLRDANAKWTERLTTSNQQLAYDKDHLMYQGKTLEQYEKANERMNAHLKQLSGADKLAEGIYDKWTNIGQAIADANKTAKENLAYAAKGEYKKITGIDYEQFLAADGSFNFKQFEEEVDALRKSNVQNIVDSGESLIQGNYAGGFINGNGTRDSVLSKLTPGEFVVRKSMVNKYGQGMFEKINQGSFSLPRYSVEGNPSIKPTSVSNVTAPVYNNTYSINVPVNQPNASADEIAYKVMTKIKGIESANIRRVNGY